MDGKYLNNICNWINRTKDLIDSDNSYFDSYHIDELVNCSKKDWIEKSVNVYNLMNDIIKNTNLENIICLLVITLNRKRKSKSVTSIVNYQCIDKQCTPPEIYLISTKNIEILEDILLNSVEVNVDGYKHSRFFYKEKFQYGFDRYLWFFPDDCNIFNLNSL